jgi:signal recognition particle subunit SRP72
MSDKAVRDYTILVKANPDDKEVLVDLVEACAGNKPELAKDYIDILATPPVRPGQTSNAELATLEASAPGLKRHNDKSAVPSKSTKMIKKKRANPPAKNINPDQPPNPERWLPKRERSDYKPKGRKRGAAGKLATGPQGLSLPGSGGGGTGSARIDGKR